MSHDRHARLPISTRHAFALSFDLAVRRDPIHSLAIPLLLHAPWVLALALLPSRDDSDRPNQVVMLQNVALIGDFAIQLIVGAMLRFRAASVFNTPASVHPAPASECYGRGLARVPWLFVTECARNLLLVFAAFFFVFPSVILGFRLSFATEAVVLSESHLSGAFGRSFRFTQGRFERWLEMIGVSVFLGLSGIFVAVAACVALGFRGVPTLLAVTQLTIAALTPIIQYAWTFFYLRLVEIDARPPGVEVGPAYAAQPEPAIPLIESLEPANPPVLALVEPAPPEALHVDHTPSA